MRVLRRAIVLVFAMGNVLVGQSVSDARLAVSIRSIPLGASVRVAIPEGRITGQLLTTLSDSLVLAIDGREQRVALARIDTVWTQGPATHKWMWRVAEYGAVVGAIVGSFANILCGANSCHQDRDAAIGLVLGAGAGALAGTGADSAVRGWDQRYP